MRTVAQTQKKKKKLLHSLSSLVKIFHSFSLSLSLSLSLRLLFFLPQIFFFSLAHRSLISLIPQLAGLSSSLASLIPQLVDQFFFLSSSPAFLISLAWLPSADRSPAQRQQLLTLGWAGLRWIFVLVVLIPFAPTEAHSFCARCGFFFFFLLWTAGSGGGGGGGGCVCGWQ